MMFIIRSGIQILCDHPRLYFSRNSTPAKDEWLRLPKPVPDEPLWTAKDDSVALPGQLGLPGIRHSIGLARWWRRSGSRPRQGTVASHWPGGRFLPEHTTAANILDRSCTTPPSS
jgi:hypothetical protein